MLLSICRSRITVIRNSSQLFTPAAATASFSVTSIPSRDATVQIVLSAATTGEVTITGTKGGSPASETLTFSSTMVNVTFQKFSTVTSIACNAAIVSAGPTVTATYISGSGANISTQSEVVSNWPADFTRAKPYGQTNYLTNDAGAFQVERGFIVTPYTDAWEPLTGDTILLTGENNGQFFVEGTALIESPSIMQHWEIFVQKRNQSKL